MGRIRLGDHPLCIVVRLVDGQLVDAVGRDSNLRPLHLASVLPLRMEQERASVRKKPALPQRIRVGERHSVRHSGGVDHPSVRIPDVRDPLFVDGEDPLGRRLSLCKQGDVRPADAQHAAFVPLRAPHDALLADQEVVQRGGEMALPPFEGVA